MERIPLINLGRLTISRRPMTASEAAVAFMHACVSVDVLPSVAEREALSAEIDLPRELRGLPHDWGDPESKW